MHLALEDLRPWPERYVQDIISFTLGHALPFIGSVGAAREGAIHRLFEKIDDKIAMPIGVEILSMVQSLFGALLLFLFLQAIRNHFRLK